MATMMNSNKKTNLMGHEIGKLLALCAFAAMMSTFGPFALIAPAALALAFIHFGKVKVLLLSSLLALGIYLIGGQSLNSLGSVGTFVYSCLIGLGIDRLIHRKIHPVKGVLYGGTFAYGLICLLALIVFSAQDLSLRDLVGSQVNFFIDQLKASPDYEKVISAGGEQARELKDLVASPNLIIEQIINWVPSVLFVGIFFSLWASFYFVLRNSLAWRNKRKYPYGLLHLTFFKLPFWLVYFLIFGLVLALLGSSVEGLDFSVYGFNILYSLGALYFFQGFGVVHDYLTVKGHKGFIKSLLMTLAVVFMWRLVVLIGLLDLWVDFRKFYLKKIEGDKK